MLRVTALTATGRPAIGAKIRLDVGGARRTAMVKTGSSYLSQSELPVTFGLGPMRSVSTIDITWPNGKSERFPSAGANLALTIQEGKGIVRSVAIPAAAR
jgi:hypothetical protein